MYFNESCYHNLQWIYYQHDRNERFDYSRHNTGNDDESSIDIFDINCRNRVDEDNEYCTGHDL